MLIVVLVSDSGLILIVMDCPSDVFCEDSGGEDVLSIFGDRDLEFLKYRDGGFANGINVVIHSGMEPGN